MQFPEELRYTQEHEWTRIDTSTLVATIGITDYAQEKLGDVVFVELPEEGDDVQQDEPFGSVESVKAVSDLFSPVSGQVVEINDALVDSPEAVNDDPYGEAWLIKVKLNDLADTERLLDAQAYKDFITTQEEDEA